jgi:hypothetical protein
VKEGFCEAVLMMAHDLQPGHIAEIIGDVSVSTICCLVRATYGSWPHLPKGMWTRLRELFRKLSTLGKLNEDVMSYYALWLEEKRDAGPGSLDDDDMDAMMEARDDAQFEAEFFGE